MWSLFLIDMASTADRWVGGDASGSPQSLQDAASPALPSPAIKDPALRKVAAKI